MALAGNATFSPNTMPLPGPSQSSIIEVTNVSGNTLTVSVQLFDTEPALCDEQELIVNLPDCPNTLCPVWLDSLVQCTFDEDNDGDIDHRLDLFFDGTLGTAQLSSFDATLSVTTVNTNAGPQSISIFNPTTNPIAVQIDLFDGNGNLCEAVNISVFLPECNPVGLPFLEEFVPDLSLIHI